MPVSWTTEPEGRFVVLLPTDPATFEEWRTAMLSVLAAPASKPRLKMLIDRRHSEPLSVEFVNQMTDFFATHQRALSGSRRAIVVSDDVAFGMARMTELKSALENPDSIARVFRSYPEAVQWLAGA